MDELTQEQKNRIQEVRDDFYILNESKGHTKYYLTGINVNEDGDDISADDWDDVSDDYIDYDEQVQDVLELRSYSSDEVLVTKTDESEMRAAIEDYIETGKWS